VNGELTYTFTGNGSHTFIVQDEAGNTVSLIAFVDRIDTISPQVSLLTYSPSTATNGNVKATLVFNESVQQPE
jgi:hypothetical protein